MSKPNNRGELTIVVAGRTLILKPTFTALDELESRLNTGVFAMLQTFSDVKGLRLGTIANVLHCGAVGGMGKAAPSLEEIGDLVLKEGATNVMEHVAAFIQMAVLSPEQIAESEAEAEAEKEATKVGE